MNYEATRILFVRQEIKNKDFIQQCLVVLSWMGVEDWHGREDILE